MVDVKELQLRNNMMVEIRGVGFAMKVREERPKMI